MFGQLQITSLWRIGGGDSGEVTEWPARMGTQRLNRRKGVRSGSLMILKERKSQ